MDWVQKAVSLVEGAINNPTKSNVKGLAAIGCQIMQFDIFNFWRLFFFGAGTGFMDLDDKAAELYKKACQKSCQLGDKIAQTKNPQEAAKIQEQRQNLESLKLLLGQISGAACASKKSVAKIKPPRPSFTLSGPGGTNLPPPAPPPITPKYGINIAGSSSFPPPSVMPKYGIMPAPPPIMGPEVRMLYGIMPPGASSRNGPNLPPPPPPRPKVPPPNAPGSVKP
jgi:hypothetical protein